VPARALMHNGFTSFKQPCEAYFSSFARATQYAIGQEPILSLGGSIPPVFALHSQAVLLFQHTHEAHRCVTVFAWLLRANLVVRIARPQLLSDSGPAFTFSLAATGVISF